MRHTVLCATQLDKTCRRGRRPTSPNGPDLDRSRDDVLTLETGQNVSPDAIKDGTACSVAAGLPPDQGERDEGGGGQGGGAAAPPGGRRDHGGEGERRPEPGPRPAAGQAAVEAGQADQERADAERQEGGGQLVRRRAERLDPVVHSDRGDRDAEHDQVCVRTTTR